MSENAALDLPMVRALVRLRFTLEHAIGLARDPSEPGAHIAIVALDGAVEYALWLVARTYGVPLKQLASRHELLTKVRATLSPGADGKDWKPAGGGPIDQLHRARNDAQHAAVRFDASQLPDWSTAARAFIESLVNAAFGQPLSGVALADAVRDADLADLLRQAEAAIEQPEPSAEAFALLCSAFDEARNRWREQQIHAHGLFTFQTARRAEELVFGVADPEVSLEERLADFLEVSPFAIDLGEYSWFVGARRQAEGGWVPAAGDSRRALVFVSGWIVRWEVFERGYPLEQWERRLAGLAPPTRGDGSKTEIVEAEAFLTTERPGFPARCELSFLLANVLDRLRGPWASWLLRELTDPDRKYGRHIRLSHPRLVATGWLSLSCELGYEADVVAEVVQRAVERADWEYQQWEERESARRTELNELQDRFTALFESARSSRALFDTVAVEERAADAKVVVSLGFNLRAAAVEELGLCANGFRSLGGAFVSTGVVRDRLVFEAPELTPETETVIRDVVRSCEELVFERRTLRARRERDFGQFAERLRGFFSERG